MACRRGIFNCSHTRPQGGELIALGIQLLPQHCCRDADDEGGAGKCKYQFVHVIASESVVVIVQGSGQPLQRSPAHPIKWPSSDAAVQYTPAITAAGRISKCTCRSVVLVSAGRPIPHFRVGGSNQEAPGSSLMEHPCKCSSQFQGFYRGDAA